MPNRRDKRSQGYASVYKELLMNHFYFVSDTPSARLVLCLESSEIRRDDKDLSSTGSEKSPEQGNPDPKLH